MKKRKAGKKRKTTKKPSGVYYVDPGAKRFRSLSTAKKHAKGVSKRRTFADIWRKTKSGYFTFVGRVKRGKYTPASRVRKLRD